VAAQDSLAVDEIRRDELLVDWLAQDSEVKAHEDFFAGGVAARCPFALAKHGIARSAGESWQAALSRYCSACLKRRVVRLAGVLSTARRWVYARHAVMGDGIFAYTECLTDPAGMRYWPHRGSGLYIAEPDDTAKRTWSAAYHSLTHATWRRIWGYGRTKRGWGATRSMWI
jgi:hypothetical protein